MKQYLDGIGRAVPYVLQVATDYELRGNPDSLLLYGYYEWGASSWWRKVLLGVRNGAGLRHQHQRKGTGGGG
jgi:hypothetical protein